MDIKWLLSLHLIIQKEIRIKNQFISVILPLAVPKAYSYIVPAELRQAIQIGKRVEVPLKNKLYSAIIVESHEQLKSDYKLKSIVSVIDDEPIVLPHQYKFWKWIADYYCCTIGEVMNAALPSALKLSSETMIIANDDYYADQELTDDEYLVAEAITIQNELSIDEIRDILDKKTVYPLIRDLIDKGVVLIKEELQQRYKAKEVSFVRLAEAYQSEDIVWDEVFIKIKKSKHQTNALLSFIQLSRSAEEVPVSAIYEMAGVTMSVLRSLEKKGIFEIFKKEISRLVYDSSEGELPDLSEEQVIAVEKIDEIFAESKVCLLHGVTGSGKTRVYMELIQRMIDEGKQVLYLLPEIALTTQIVDRLQFIFGEHVGVFHSKMSNNERVELWKDAIIGKKVMIGARSALFLPFSNLGLIVVDEEHDPSYKQYDPNPRYNARDAAIYLGHMLKADVLLGTATPSLETYVNVKGGRYGKVELNNRYGNVKLPAFEVVDLKYARKTGRMTSMFSHRLLEKLKETINLGEQAILFQNRRGYTPVVTCDTCGWKAECKNCDISTTYHKYFDESRCHLCGYRAKKPVSCPACGNTELDEFGFGTEKIESDLREAMPAARIARFDYDSARSKNAFLKILHEFGNREIDILVGTQMVTKGLDFDNISTVGILNADSLFRFPDFRADERAFQLITQVAGRAGRRKKQGEVIIQTYSSDYPVIDEIINYDYDRFAIRNLQERKSFIYPPFFRMIGIEISHKKHRTAYEAAEYLCSYLKHTYGNRIIGPAEPGVARIKGYYLQQITIKMERNNKTITAIKSFILKMTAQMKNTPGFKSVRVKINVDPY